MAPALWYKSINHASCSHIILIKDIAPLALPLSGQCHCQNHLKAHVTDVKAHVADVTPHNHVETYFWQGMLGFPECFRAHWKAESRGFAVWSTMAARTSLEIRCLSLMLLTLASHCYGSGLIEGLYCGKVNCYDGEWFEYEPFDVD